MHNSLSVSMHSLKQVLENHCTRIRSGEKQLIEALWRWQYTIKSDKLRNVLSRYIDVCKDHLQQLNPLLIADISAAPSQNRVIQALILDTDVKLLRCGDDEVASACLLASIQEINHYKISLYGTAASFAMKLGIGEQEEIFRKAEGDEKRIDDRLTQLALFEVNAAAVEPHVVTV